MMIDLPDRIAGRYRIEERIGHGAIAEVVRAFDEQRGRRVALKVLYPALRENAVVVERFRREVELVRRIQHPHVLGIQDVVESDGLLFLVMDYHPGGDLADRLARGGPLPVEALRAVAAQLGGALAAAHRVGVVHRDVKPSNVLAGPGATLDVRLCDFGLARSAEGAGLTTSTAVLGTPEYMAPEVIADGHADPRSDLYSLGVMLFEAATGRLPFTADSPYQLMRLHLQDQPPRARDFRPELPPELDEAIARALAKDPLDRFARADELVDAFALRETPAGAALAVAPRPAPPRGTPCPACGGWLVELAAVCVDCGHELLRLEHQAQGGVSVLVVGPGAPGDKLAPTLHVALFRLLRELPAEWTRRDRARAPRLPFFVAREITAESAERLLPRLTAIGLEARVERGWALRPREMRRKVNAMVGRYLAGAGFFAWFTQMRHILPDDLLPNGAGMVVVPVTVIAVFSTAAAAAARRYSRPLLALEATSATSSPHALAGILRRLRHRQDRRLIARILHHLGQLAAVPRSAPLAGVAEQSSRVAAALAAVDEADEALSSSPLDATQAQHELRRLERGRVLLRAELLRISSHLERLSAGEARAGAAGTALAIEEASEATEDLSLEVEAHHELEQFLAGRPAAG